MQYTVSGLDEDKTYYFAVRARNSAGEGLSSNVVSWSYVDTEPPLPPKGIHVE
jgi:hypothetical protein